VTNYLTSKDVAEYLGISRAAVNMGRAGKGPLAGLKFLKLGEHTIRYTTDLVDEFVEKSLTKGKPSKGE
jgi:predicted transcriptional regulator